MRCSLSRRRSSSGDRLAVKPAETDRHGRHLGKRLGTVEIDRRPPRRLEGHLFGLGCLAAPVAQPEDRPASRLTGVPQSSSCTRRTAAASGLAMDGGWVRLKGESAHPTPQFGRVGNAVRLEQAERTMQMREMEAWSTGRTWLTAAHPLDAGHGTKADAAVQPGHTLTFGLGAGDQLIPIHRNDSQCRVRSGSDLLRRPASAGGGRYRPAGTARPPRERAPRPQSGAGAGSPRGPAPLRQRREQVPLARRQAAAARRRRPARSGGRGRVPAGRPATG